MPRQTCTVCASPALDAINHRLRNGVFLRTIAEETRFPKSVLGRHKLNCLGKLSLESTKNFNPKKNRLLQLDEATNTIYTFVFGNDGKPQRRNVALSEVQDTDWFLRIETLNPPTAPKRSVQTETAPIADPLACLNAEQRAIYLASQVEHVEEKPEE
jgi:hypothetical protein